jgi:hypothetical protein
LIVVGDQDSYHSTEHDVVSSPIWLADILLEEGLTGLFVVQATRAAILAEQGRTDVIRAMRRHEIGLHGRDVHPVLPEIVEGLGWDAGVAALQAVEEAELRELGRIFDVAPVGSSQHRGYAPPQIHGVAQRLGLPYLFGYPAAPPAHSLSWYAGALNVPFNAPVPEFLGFFPAVFDDVLADDDAFAALLQQLRQHVVRCLAVGLPLLVVFVCHPERLCYSGALEQWRYGNGINHGPDAVPPGVERRRAPAEIARSLANFRATVRYLRDTPGLAPITVRELNQRYGHQSATISRTELAQLAGEALRSRQIPIGQDLSAAETLVGFADSLVHHAQTGGLPSRLPRRDVLGPVTSPPLAPDPPGLSAADVVQHARELVRAVGDSGQLPAALRRNGQAIGLGSLYGTFAETYRDLAAGGALPADGLTLAVWPRYPAYALPLGERQRLCLEDPLIRPGLSTDAAAEQARLQTWTLKPAQRR